MEDDGFAVFGGGHLECSKKVPMAVPTEGPINDFGFSQHHTFLLLAAVGTAVTKLATLRSTLRSTFRSTIL